MAVVGVTHSKVVTIPDDPNYPVGSDEWNAQHVITGLENVDNTSDANKPVSTAQAAADAVVAANAANASNLTSGTLPTARLPSIITGAIFNSPMTGAGEVFSYSFRNSATTGQQIYDPTNGGSPINLQDNLQSAMVVPVGATAAGANALSSYFQSNSAAVNAVGLFTTGQGTVANAPIWGINTLLTDNATRVTHSRTGQILIGAELDFNVMGANTQVIGVSVGGNSLAAPTNANAFIANSLGGTAKWGSAFSSIDGAAVIGLAIGSTVANGTSTPSQTLQMLYFDAGSTRRVATLQASDSGFSLTNGQSGLTFRLGATGVTHGQLAFSGLTSGLVTIAPQLAAGSPTLTLPNTSGTLVATASAPLVRDATTGNLTLTATGTGSAVLATAPTFSGGTVTIQNNLAGGLTFQAASSDTAQAYFTIGNTSVGGKTWQFAVEGSAQLDPGAFYFFDGTGYRFGISSSGGVILGAAPVSGQALGSLLATNFILSNHATAGVGYATGAGGTITQATSKATGVTLNKASGAITMNAAALAAGTIVSFVLTDSAIAATDVLILNHISGGTPGSYSLNARCAAGSATIDVRNNTAGSLSEAIVIQFALIKGVNA